MDDRLIITGASEPFSASLLAMLGSLDANWPGHPRVVIYDIGLEAATLERLARAGIEVRRVPPFVPHWRLHFTWKVWAWNDAEGTAAARHILWMDAGLAVLQSLDEIFSATARLGYWTMATYHGLESTVSDAACDGCRVLPEFRRGRMMLAGNLIAWDKEGPAGPLVAEALRSARHEPYMAASEPLHRHDQAIISVLFHRDLAPLVISDGAVYGGWQSPTQTPAQKVWAHRRRIGTYDLRQFTARLGTNGQSYVPTGRPDATPQRSLKQAYWDTRHRIRTWLNPSRGSAWVYDGVRS